MRRIMLVLVAGSVSACAYDVTAPTRVPSPNNSLAAVNSESVGPWGFGRRGFGRMGALLFARRLPASLQLSAAQRTRIRSLMSEFRARHRDDLTSLATVAKQAHAAHASGVPLTVDERRALGAQTAPARQRLVAANKTLRDAIQNVLTADQRAWLASHRPTLRRANGSAQRWTGRHSGASRSATTIDH